MGDKVDPAIYATTIEICGDRWVAVYLDRQHGVFTRHQVPQWPFRLGATERRGGWKTAISNAFYPTARSRSSD
jgi:hypothetical protein